MADKQNKDGAAAGAGKPAASGGKKGEESKKEEVKDVLATEELVSFNNFFRFKLGIPISPPAFVIQNEEDQLLKEKLELLVERLTDRDQAQRVHALDQLKLEISGATKTMTSVPKPLKFLSPKFADIKAAYEAQTDATMKVRQGPYLF